MKKLGSLLVVMALAVSLVGCGSKDNDKEDSGVLRVAMECAYAPYNWTQPDDVNDAVKIAGSKDYAYGYDVMWAKEIADSMGKELEIVKLDWDSLVPAVMTGDVDCVIAGQSITPDRLEKVDFTSPYYYASIVTVVRKGTPFVDAKGISDLEGAVLTSQLGTVWYDTCIGQIPNGKILPAQESAPAMIVALTSGAVDAVVTDLPTALAAITVNDDLQLLDFTGTEDNFEVSKDEINIGISVKKGNAELLEAINKVVESKSVDDINTMMNEAIQVQPLSQD